MSDTLKESCKAKTKLDRWPYTSTSPCGRKVWKDGFCKIHHPDEKRRRQDIRDKKKDDLYNARQEKDHSELTSALASRDYYKELAEAAEKIVLSLAEWSRKYPRGPIYPMSQKKMDNELIEIEERAKIFCFEHLKNNPPK